MNGSVLPSPPSSQLKSLIGDEHCGVERFPFFQFGLADYIRRFQCGGGGTECSIGCFALHDGVSLFLVQSFTFRAVHVVILITELQGRGSESSTS